MGSRGVDSERSPGGGMNAGLLLGVGPVRRGVAPHGPSSERTRELVAAETVRPAVNRLREQFQVLRDVVGFVLVAVVNVVTLRDGAVEAFPNVSVQVAALVGSTGVIAVGSDGVLPASPHDVRQGLDRPHLQSPLREHLENGLSGYAERTSHTGQAVALLVESVHGGGFGVLTRRWHENNIRNG